MKFKTLGELAQHLRHEQIRFKSQQGVTFQEAVMHLDLLTGAVAALLEHVAGEKHVQHPRLPMGQLHHLRRSP